VGRFVGAHNVGVPGSIPGLATILKNARSFESALLFLIQKKPPKSAALNCYLGRVI